MIYVHKILPVFVSPLGIVLILLAFSIIFKKKYAAVIAFGFLWLMSMPLTSQHVSQFVERGYERLAPGDVAQSDAIVVLSGMSKTTPSPSGPIMEWSDADRFFAGIELFENNRAPELIFTQGELPWTNQPMPEGAFLSQYAQKMGVDAAHIRLTSPVMNTADEARAVRQLIKDERATLILVTSAYHMPRAQRLFEQQGFEIIPYAVDFKQNNDAITLMAFLPNASALANTSMMLREMLGRLRYALF